MSDSARSDTAATTNDRRIPELDGFRGIAILLVLAFHYAQLSIPQNVVDRVVLGAARAGWVGVDLFFVLSGFLITGILYDTREARNYFQSFYARRFLRIFPLYYAALAVLFIVLPALGHNLIGPSLSSGPWFWLHASNFLVIWEGFPHRHLQHFWSLAIEEQFYAIWPLPVIFLPRRWLIGVALAVIVLAAALRGVLYRDGLGVTANYYNTLTRADTLALGALIALLIRDPFEARWLKRLAPWTFAVALPAALALLSLSTTRPAWASWRQSAQVLGYPIIGVTCAAAIAWSVTNPELRLNRFLRSRPLRFLGRYSYGIYVIHIPVDTIARARKLHVASIVEPLGGVTPWLVLYAIVAGSVTVGLALVSWNLLEKRFLALKRHFEPRVERRSVASTRASAVRPPDPHQRPQRPRTEVAPGG